MEFNAGGTEGNERLTVVAGYLLFVGLAVLGLTIVRIGQLLWLHLFLGLALIGPVALKLTSTGYRFVRYYAADPRYRAKGPPAPALRTLAPLVVGLTVIVFATGVILLFVGPADGLRPKLVLIHKVSFIVWIVFTAVHVVGHLPELLRTERISAQTRREIGALRAEVPGFGGPAEPPLKGPLPGAGGRRLSLAGALVVGLVLAAALIPQFSAWTEPGVPALLHHHRVH
ncbi:MAG TPA: hypothetical protein VHX62_09580 [Solirubrobacteraceae bacterium]|jgi:hypothetical protein|nr:hypothetical protein [Solirubrobacteraceae bacterium]